MKKKVLVFVSLAVFCATVHILASRPLSTDDMGTVEKGKTEMEIGYDFNHGAAGEDAAHAAGVWIGHGVTDNLDLEIVLPYFISPVRGTGLISFGLKLLFFAEKENTPGFAATVFTEPGEPEYTINGILSKTFGSAALHMNFGYEATGAAGEQGRYFYSVAGEYNITERISAAAEITDSTEESFIHHGVSPFIGARFVVADWVIIDAGAGMNLSDETRPVHVAAGLSLKL